MESQTKIKPKFRPNPDIRLMDQVREILRFIHHFGGKTHPDGLGDKDGEQYLSPLATGVNIRALQELPGRADVKTTEIHTRVMSTDIRRLQSPVDMLPGSMPEYDFSHLVA